MANAFVNKKADLTSTDATTLYTVPTATTAVIKSILVSEDEIKAAKLAQGVAHGGRIDKPLMGRNRYI